MPPLRSAAPAVMRRTRPRLTFWLALAAAGLAAGAAVPSYAEGLPSDTPKGAAPHSEAAPDTPKSVASRPEAASDAPRLILHQDYIDDISRKTNLDIDNPMAVFEFVINNLPERVKVYPSESYFYFKIIHNGRTYGGNIRIDIADRSAGVIHFAYFPEYTLWWKSDEMHYKKITKEDGVDLEELGKLSYKITYKAKTVNFELRNLKDEKPPANTLAPNEVFIGPTEDESGLRFFLIFNPKLKLFLFVLNENASVPEHFHAVRYSNGKVSSNVTVGERTGFAFYQDKKLSRHILIGVFEGNSMVNNYFDGPFDQLPDNFVEGDALRNAVVTVDPSLKGKVDRFGADPKGDERFAINPYIYYGSPDDLNIVERCVRNKKETRQYYTCFNYGMSHRGQGPTEEELSDSKPSRGER